MDLHLDHEYTLNPDGSGKVSVRWEGDAPSPDLQPETFIGSEVGMGRGIDAWDAVACDVVEGRLKFTATAYFKDVAQLRFHCQGLHVHVLDFAVSRDAKGNVVVKTVAPEAPTADLSGESEEALRARLAEERPKFEAAKGFMEGMVGGLVCTAALRLPAAVGSLKGGKKAGPKEVRTRFEGKVVLDLLDRLMTDDDLALRLLRSGKQGPEALTELLGDEGLLEVTTKGDASPQFDYESEVDAARQRFEALSESLNLPKPPAKGAPMENARIVAVKMVREADSDRELHPMGQNYRSLSFTIVGDLPPGVVKADEGRMDAAVTVAGENLVPDDDWKRRISFPKMTKDRRTAFFDVEFPLPDGELGGFREIRGSLQVVVSSDVEEVDLGFKKLEAGEAGKQFGASIERFEPQDEERTTLEIKFQIAMERIESLALQAPKGDAVVLSQQGYSSSGDECVLTYGIEGPIPKKAKLVAKVSKKVQQLEIPFEVRDVDELGRPK